MSVWKSQRTGQWKYEFVRKGRRFQSGWLPTKADAQKGEKDALRRLGELNTAFIDLCTARESDLEEIYRERLEKFVGVRPLPEHYLKTLRLIGTLRERWARKKEITSQDVRDLLDEEARVSPNRRNKTLRLVRALFNFGINRELIERNPTRGIKMLPVSAAERYVPPFEDILKVLATANEDERLYLTVIINTMGRVRSVNYLKWVDVREDHLILRTRKSKNSNEKEVQIPLNRTLKEALARIPRRSEYVFARPKTGKPYNYRWQMMDRLCRKAGVKQFAYHALRHYGASRLIQTGVPLSVVQQLLGHERVTTTAIYVRALGNDLREAMDKFEAVHAAHENLLLGANATDMEEHEVTDEAGKKRMGKLVFMPTRKSHGSH